VDGGLAAGLVPQDLDVEGVQQPCLQVRRQAGQNVPCSTAVLIRPDGHAAWVETPPTRDPAR
jgi:hypothetical protein